MAKKTVLHLFFFITSFCVGYASSCTEEDYYFLPEGNTEFDVLKNYSLVDNLDVKAKLFRKHTTRGGYRIAIYDKVLTQTNQRLLQALLTYRLGSWSYRIPEAYVKNGQNHVSMNNIPWYNEINSLEFSDSVIGKQLQKVVSTFAGEEAVEYYLYKVVGHIVRRGDYPKVHADAYPEDDEISMMIYLNRKWRKNDYGDLYLYDDNKEIVAGVVPRYGRIVVWQSSIPYLPRPPSVAFKPGQLFLHVCFTKNQTKVQEVHSKWLENERIGKSIHTKGFFSEFKHPSPEEKVDLETRMVSAAKSKNGERIVVFDGLFSENDLDELRSNILNYGVYYYDDSYDEESDNVQWIAGFDVDHYVKNKMWKITQKVAKFVSGGHSDWFPYDISCNLIRNADTTQVHHDCDNTEDEWTFLLYLNPGWTVNDYGETVFYEKNDDETEIITEVLPKYGRVVIFQGVIPHSARPPSTNFTGARLSFAVKLSKNEWIGRKKAFQEEFRHLSAVKSMLNLFERFLDGGSKTVQSDEHDETATDDDSNNDELHNDPEATEARDSQLEELTTKLETLLTNKDSDIKELRTLVREVHRSHLAARNQVGDLIRQIL